LEYIDLYRLFVLPLWVLYTLFPNIKVLGMASQIYKGSRMAVIVLFMALNFAFVVLDIVNRRFPIGVGPMLCLLPCFLRELDLKSGRAPRTLGRLGWSYILGGVIWVVSWPLLAR
jgi:hypothetical protein